jgi:two-component system KDP operon response regulator KdpE
MDTGPRVLIVDDEQAIRRLLRSSLSAHGYSIHEAESGEEALQRLPAIRPDVLILDLGLPGMGGAEVARCIREWSQVPIMVLSVRDHETDKIDALDSGADDYLTKPFSMGELLARLRAMLRRGSRQQASPVFTSGPLTVDLSSREVRLEDRRIQLTPTEYEILKVFINNSGKVMTHRQLVREVWSGLSYEDELHLLRVNISNLRRKLERDPSRPQLILTEAGVGYRLQTEA